MCINKILIISANNYSINKVLNEYDDDANIVWLQLWPSFETGTVQIKYPKILIETSLDYITKDDHYRVAEDVVYISNNWWSLLGFDNCEKEWHIQKLKMTQIFAYELEQVLTNCLFQILIVNRVIKNHQPDKIIFIESEGGGLYDHIDYLNIFSRLKLFEFFESLNISFKSINNTSAEIENKDSMFTKFLEISSFSDKVNRKFRRLTQKAYSKKLTSGNILISNSDRCLHKLVDHPEYKRKIAIIKDKEVQSIKKASKSLPLKFNEMFFEDVSLNPFFRKWLIYTEGRFNYLKLLFNETIELINRHSPLLYITVNIANSTEIVKMWAYHKAGIRSVLACEGLGQPGEDLDIVVDSVVHPEIKIERWVSSINFANKFKNNGKPVKVTGYLDGAINKEYVPQIKQHSKTITYALSIVNPLARRAIVGEDIFEMLNSIKEVSSVLAYFDGYELNIKLHPGDEKNIPLYNEYIDEACNARLIASGDLNQIIDESALVIIYDTSVGMEALLRRKNVICYNYTKRDTYITSIYENVNHDPEQGAAMLMATDRHELKLCIDKLLPFSNNTKPSPGLEYLLENARDGYNAEEVVRKLIQ